MQFDSHSPPHSTSSIASDIFFSDFRQLSAALQNNTCTYHSPTDDFGIEIQTLLISRLNQSTSGVSIEATLKNMETICEELGIELKSSHESYHLRDLWIRSPSGELLSQKESIFSFWYQSHKELLNKTLEQTIDFFLLSKRSAFARSDHLLLKQGISGNFFDSYEFIQNDETTYFKDFKKKFLLFCSEGGNVLKLTGNDGRIKILVGEFQFYMTLNAYLLEKELIEKASKLPFSEHLIKKYMLELTRDDISELIQEMALQGLIPSFSKINDPEECKVLAATYAWQKLYIQGLISATFNVLPEDVIIVPQIYYHLDYFLKSGPYHSLLINSHEATAKLLEKALKHSKALNLTQVDIQLLHVYIETAWKVHRELDPLYKRTCALLEKAHLTPIPTPGIFLFENPSASRSLVGNFNFLNALSGWSSKKNNYYYITSGAQVGDKLGAVLMDIYDIFLKSLQPGMDVYFLGRDPKNLEDFSEPMAWWNTPLAQFGVHCFTLELETKSHTNVSNSKKELH